MIDFNDIQGLVDFCRGLMSLHDPENLDLSGYRSVNLDDEAEVSSVEHLREMMEKDLRGEYLGRIFHHNKDHSGLHKFKTTNAFFDGDRLIAVLDRAAEGAYNIEFFEYYDDFSVSVMSTVLTKVFATVFTFYLPSGDKTGEMVTVYDPKDAGVVRLEKYELEYIEGKTSVKSAETFIYKQRAKGYELDKKFNMSVSPETQKKTKPVFDNQKKLCKKLEKEIKQDMTLDQAIDAFFKVVSSAKPNDEEMLLFEVGCYPFEGSENSCLFCLVRQTPSPDDEFYQMHMIVVFEAGKEEKKLNESVWHEEVDDDLREYVLASKAYKILKNKQIKKIAVWVDET